MNTIFKLLANKFLWIGVAIHAALAFGGAVRDGKAPNPPEQPACIKPEAER